MACDAKLQVQAVVSHMRSLGQVMVPVAAPGGSIIYSLHPLSDTAVYVTPPPPPSQLHDCSVNPS